MQVLSFVALVTAVLQAEQAGSGCARRAAQPPEPACGQDAPKNKEKTKKEETTSEYSLKL